MDRREYNLVLDFEGNNSTLPAINMFQNDTDIYKINAILIFGRQAIDLTNCSVRFIFEKPNNTSVYKYATIINANSGKVSIDIDDNITETIGRGNIQVQIKDNVLSKWSSAIFNFSVTKGLFSKDTILSTNSFYGDLLWNNVDFTLPDYIQQVKFTVSSSMTINLGIPGDHSVIPNVVCNSNMVCTANGYTATFTSSKSVDYGFKLRPGINDIQITGNGDINFQFRKDV